LFEAAACANLRRIFAGIAQLVEQLICNQQVVGSNPTAGSIQLQPMAAVSLGIGGDNYLDFVFP
jgi:hypothetical protein